MLQASVCDEQLTSIGVEIALSGNKKTSKKKKKKEMKNAQGTVADFAVVALAATLDATVGSESSTQPAAR